MANSLVAARFSRRILAALGAAVFLLSPCLSVRAETWILPTSGLWNVATNSTPQSVPNSVGAAAIFNSDQTANRTITYGQPIITIGSLTINNSTTFANTFGADVTVTGNSSVGGAPANSKAIRARWFGGYIRGALPTERNALAHRRAIRCRRAGCLVMSSRKRTCPNARPSSRSFLW